MSAIVNYQIATQLPALPQEQNQQVSDYQLCQRSASGDTAAFEELYNRHHRRVYSLCLRMTRDVSEAEDLSQDVFVALYKKSGTFRGDSAFTTWLHRITTNSCLMHFRKQSVKMERTTEDGKVPEQTAPGTANPGATSILQSVYLAEALDKLPPGYKRAFILREVFGFEHEEIAKLTGSSVGNSKSQAHKSREFLRKFLGTCSKEKFNCQEKESLLRGVERETLKHLIAKLTPAQSRIAELCFLTQPKPSHTEMAEILGCQKCSIHSLLSVMRDRLLQLYQTLPEVSKQSN